MYGVAIVRHPSRSCLTFVVWKIRLLMIGMQCVLIAHVLLWHGGSTAAVSVTGNGSENTCQLTVAGVPYRPDAIQQADLHCTGAHAVQVKVAAVLQPFIGSFTGVYKLCVRVVLVRMVAALQSSAQRDARFC